MKKNNLYLEKKRYKTLLSNNIELQNDKNFNVICYIYGNSFLKKNCAQSKFFYKKLVLQSHLINGQQNIINNIKLPLVKKKFKTYFDFQNYQTNFIKKKLEIFAFLIYKSKIFLGEGIFCEFCLMEQNIFLRFLLIIQKNCKFFICNFFLRCKYINKTQKILVLP